jgi:chromosome partitioning protein
MDGDDGGVQRAAMIVALAGLKGGTGKSTLTLGLASVAQARGLRVIVVDLDPIATATTYARLAGDTVPRTFCLAGKHRPTAEALRALARGFDLVLVDLPSNDAETLAVVAAAADELLVPCSPSPLDAWALASTLDVIRRVSRPEQRARLVLNRIDARTRMGKGAAASLRKHVDLELCPVGIPSSVDLVEVLAAALPVRRGLVQGSVVEAFEQLLASTQAQAHATTRSAVRMDTRLMRLGTV